MHRVCSLRILFINSENSAIDDDGVCNVYENLNVQFHIYFCFVQASLFWQMKTAVCRQVKFAMCILYFFFSDMIINFVELRMRLRMRKEATNNSCFRERERICSRSAAVKKQMKLNKIYSPLLLLLLLFFRASFFRWHFNASLNH